MNRSKLIPSEWNVPQEFHQRLGDRPGRQRVLMADGHLMFVLHEPPKPNEATRKPRLFWRKPDGSWNSTTSGDGLSAFNGHLEEYSKAVDQCENLEETATTGTEYFAVLEAVSPLKRSAENLYHVLQDARKLVADDRDIINLRDQAYDVSRTADLLYDATRNGMEMAQTRRAEEQAQASMEMASAAHRLNWFVAFFFPLATLTAVFGMQLGTGLEHFQTPWPFAIVCGVGLLAGVVLSGFVLRSKR